MKDVEPMARTQSQPPPQLEAKPKVAFVPKEKPKIDKPPPPKTKVAAKPYKKQEKQQPKPQKTQSRNKKGSKETLDRIVASKTGDFAAWYGEVITKSEMIEYGNVRKSHFKRPSI